MIPRSKVWGLAASSIVVHVILLTAACLLPRTLSAHGGQYLGPTTGGPPRPGGRPVTPGMIPGGPTTGGSANLDVSSWRVWWELNNDRYVSRHPRTAGVDDEVLASTVVPSLRIALERTEDPDVDTACLVALGKVGVDDPRVLDLIRAGLSRNHIEVREAAVLALGLSGSPEVLDDLDALLKNSADGRRLSRRDSVSDRVRTFAAYALGLVANRSGDAEVKQKALDSLIDVLEDGRTRDRDVLTGVLNGIRIIAPDPARGGAHKRVLWTAVAALEKFLERRMRDQMAAVQTHALTALAGLVGRGDGVEQQRAKELVVARLEGSRADPMNYVSATIALGKLLQPEDEDAFETLARRVANPPDPMVRNLGMIAFGEIGGAAALEQLRRAFGQSDREVQAWAALGLGLLAFHSPTATTESAQQEQVVDLRPEVGDVLRAGLRSNRNKDVLAAIAIGLGLAGTQDAVPELRKLLDEISSLDEFAGHVCVSLAMLGDRASIPSIQAGMSTADRSVRFGHAALALASFDLVDASSAGVAVLSSGGGGGGEGPWRLRRLAAAAKAVGHFKNAGDVAILAQMVEAVDRTSKQASPTNLRSAFAAAALGSVADRDPLGFGPRVADGMNYTATVQTISNGSNGILDIF